MLPFLQFILAIAIIIAVAKLGGYLSQRVRQPTVAGKVLVGLILGPSLLNFLQWPIFTDPHLGETIAYLAELGVLLLMFGSYLVNPSLLFFGSEGANPQGYPSRLAG